MANQPDRNMIVKHIMPVKEKKPNDHQSQQGYYLSLAQDSL